MRRTPAAVAITKFTPPKPPRRLVATERLARWRDAILRHDLTLVMAPSGFGKTTCCAAWHRVLAERGAVVAWASFDVDDNQSGRALTCLLAAIDGAAPGLIDEARALLAGEASAPAQTLAALLINAMSGRAEEFVLFLDDFHRLRDPGALQFLCYVLLHCPNNLHFVIACQARPELPIGRLSASDSVQLLDGEALRLQPQETRALLADHATPLAEAEIDSLHEAMDGWVTGLKIGAIAMRHNRDALADGGAAARGGSWLAAYLGDSVFDHLPEPVRLFLMRCSIVELQTAALCERLSPGGDTHATLEWLADQNLFLQPLGDGETFRLHPVFRAFLQERLARARPAEPKALHRAAADWYAGSGRLREAIRHAIAGGDLDRAANWIEQAAMGMIERFDPITLLDWIALLPAEAVAERSALRLAQAWALTIGGRAQVVPLLEELQAELESDATVHAGRALELLGIRAIFAGLYEDDSGLALELASEYMRHGHDPRTFAAGTMRNALSYGLMQRGDYREAQACVTVGRFGLGPDNDVVEAYRRSIRGLAHRRQGHLAEAERLFRSGLLRSEQGVGAGSASATLNACLLAESLYERDAVGAADAVLTDRFAQIRVCSFADSVIAAYRVATSIRLLRGDAAGAADLLDEAEQIGHERGWLRLLATTIVLRLRAGLPTTLDPDLLLPAGEEPVALTEPLSRGARTFAIIAEAWWLAAWREDDIDRCVAIVARARAYATATDSVPDLLRWDMLDARTRERRGEPAARALVGCIPRLVRHGFVRLAMDSVPASSWASAARHPKAGSLDQAGHALLRLLMQPASADDVPSREPSARSPAGLFRLLTAREIDILLIVARGGSNKEIARQLHLTPETVKWHLKNILRKLDCGSRADAARRGIALGLIAHPHDGNDQRRPVLA